MELKSIKKFDRVLALVLTIAALLAGQSVWAASSFTVDIQSSSSSSCTFRITRTGNTAVSETIDWRVVSLSAIAGVHFTGYNGNYSGTVTFNVNDTYKDVTISESAPGDNAYKYQDGTSRSYRFEVLDKNGDILASKDRSMTTGTQFTDTYLNKSITGLTYFDRNGDGSILSGTTHYLDVAHSGSAGTWVKVSEGGYKQAVHTVSTAALYNNNSALRTYLNSIGMKMYATVYFTQKEDDDGYQYIQILADNASTYDGDDGNGSVNTPSTSLYKACFILSYSPSGSVMSDPHTQFFPHRWDYADRATQYSDNKWDWQEFDYDNAHLYEQEFKSATYRAENSGSLVLAPTVGNLNIRFDAAGSGDDDWYFKDLKVRLALCDPTAPTVLSNYKVSGGRHQKGNVIYVSVPFSEIVTVSGTPTLATSWGTLSYCAGSGTNVLTFSGTIGSDATGTLSVTGHSGTITDLAGNALSGTVSHAFGTALDADYAWTADDFNSLGTDTYEIATKTDLRHLALLVNAAKNPCTGLTFRQTRDITCDATYIPIGYYVSSSDKAQFRGTYDGQGHTVSGITVSRTGNTEADGCVGLFGYVFYNTSTDYGTVKNVVLANSAFTGRDAVGGIVGFNNGGTVQNCRVESSVTINAGYNNAIYLGGIVGDNSNAKVIGCYSAAAVSKNGKSACRFFGGIVGGGYKGTVKDCLYAGTTVTADNYKGAIVGLDDGNEGVFSNNYYTAISLGGVGADGSSSDRDGARRARTVSLGTGVALTGTQTAYDASGLTAVGTTALQSGETIYSGATQTLTLAYSGTVPEGFMVTFSADAGTLSGTALTLGAADVTVSATVAPDYATHWHADADHDGTTAARAYIITTTTGLNLLATLVNGTVSGYAANDFSDTFFQLGGDIEYNATTAWDNTDASNTENNFTAIGGVSGNTYNYFKGTFDGDGHTISGIRITQKTKESQGLFGRIGAGGTVKNLTLSNARIFSNKERVGGIAGRSQGNITNCHVAADVNILGNGDYHGGIAGNSYGTITGCTSAAALNWSGNYRGGITGQISSSATVSDCIVIGVSYSFGSNTFLGAIVGKNFDGTGTLTRNYYRDCSVNGATTNIGVGTETKGVSNDVDGARSVHALNLGDGINADGESVTIGTDTYYAAGTDVTLANSGSAPNGFVAPYYYTVDGTDIAGSTFQMPAKDIVIGGNWTTDYEPDHAGTEADPYIINNYPQLELLATRVNTGKNYSNGKHFKLGADIACYAGDNNHTAIGINAFNKYFYGTFDGDGHIISGIRINSSSDSHGLFGIISLFATVKNVTLAGSTIIGHTNVGGIVGDNRGTVTDCRVLGDVYIYADANVAYRHGGIVGVNHDATVNGCYSAATVSRNSKSNCGYYGGIVGYLDGGTVSNCIALGAWVIGSESSSGAIVGTTHNGTLAGNYYYDCTVGTTANATNAGTGSGDVTENNGAVPADAVLSETETVPDNLSGTVAFRREFTGGKASTICLPFAMTTISGGKVYEFVDVTYDATDGWVATMSDATPGGNNVTTTEANKPYLFLPDATGAVVFGGTADYDVSGGLATTSGDWTFTGTYTNLTYGTEPMTGHIYGFASKSKTVDGHDVEAGQFVHAKEGASVPPMRCYLTYKNGAQRAPMRASALGATVTDTDVPSRITVRLVSASGTVTAVGTLDTVTGEMDINTWYDMNGRLLETEPTAPGLYIHNGKTIMIKK